MSDTFAGIPTRANGFGPDNVVTAEWWNALQRAGEDLETAFGASAVTLADIGTSPNSKGASLSGQVLTLQPANDTHGGVLSNTTQDIKGNKTFKDNVIVQGDLTVTGTTFTADVTNLEVEDQNILLNNGGNDASSEDAGIDVERTTTNAAIRFDSSLTSKWKLGLVGSLYEVVVSGVGQTIAGAKIFSSALKTLGSLGFSAGTYYTNLVQGGSPSADRNLTINMNDAARTVDLSGNLTVPSAATVSGTNTGDETTTTIGTLINGATGKTTPVDADMLGIADSAASNVLKKLTWANLKSTLKTYFDTLYPSGSGTSSGTNTGDVTLGAFGSSPDAKGATISGQVVTMQPADATHPGMLSTGTQTIPGDKTLSGKTTFAPTCETETSVSSSSNAMTIDASLGNTFYTTMSENTTLTISNMTTGQTITLIATGHGSTPYTITFPTMKKRSDFTGVVAAAKFNVYVITKRNTTLYGTVVEDMA